MKDESAFLQADELAPDAQEPPVAYLPIYHPGVSVVYQGQYCTVSHVVLSNGDLMVNLKESGATVSADKVQLAPTRILLQRS